MTSGRQVAYVGLQVEITNTTDNVIRLSSIGIGSGWGRNPPADLPVIDAERLEELAAQYEVARSTVIAALRRMDDLVEIVPNWGTFKK